jgi:hypothetical protein
MRSQPEPCGNTGNLRLHSALNYIIYPIKDSKSKFSCWGCCPVFTMQPSCWLQRARTNSFLHRSTQTLDLVNRWLKCSTKQMAASNKKAVKKMFSCGCFKQGKTRHPAHSLNHRKWQPKPQTDRGSSHWCKSCVSAAPLSGCRQNIGLTRALVIE